MSGIRQWSACGLILFLAACSPPAAEAPAPPATAAELQAAQDRGRQIYFGEEGSPLDHATARVGGMDVRLPARGFPCASCHGRSGSGFAERGAAPTDLSRGALTRPYTVSASAGRQRPPYTLASFRAAIRAGKDPGGNALAEAMPRFDLPDTDLADLWAFLEVIDTLNDPGVDDSEVRIAVAFAPGPAGEAQRRVLDMLAGDINALGGIHGRALMFEAAPPGGTPASGTFAFLVVSQAGAAPAAGQPTLYLSASLGGDPLGFSLLAGPEDEAAALRRFAVERLGVVTVQDACQPGSAAVRLLLSTDCLSGARQAGQLLIPNTVFVKLPPAERRSLPAETYVALPAPLSRVAPGAQTALARTRARAGTSRETIIAEAEAYSVAAVLIETLMRTGRELTRERFVSSLEDIRDFEGAITQPLSFGRNRRNGSRGVEVAEYSPHTGILTPTGVWIDPDR
ncbi:hypothetical protein [Hyphomonas sp.]|uniref:hypothetical protein n=1 Tax=Hyphomonas sp. TaxID=87 RepID=UPI00391D17CF